MSGLKDAILHPIETIKENFSKEAVSYQKEQDASENAKATAEKLCNIDGLLNCDIEEELAKLDYYNTMPGIEVDPALRTYLSFQSTTVNNAKNQLESLKQQYISQSESIQIQQKYLKQSKKTISGYKDSVKKAKQSITNDCSPLEYLLGYGNAKSSKESLKQAKKSLAKAKSEKLSLQLKIKGMKGKLDDIKTKISEQKEKVSKANQQVSLYKKITDKQFAIADKYIAVGAIAKQTGLANGSNPANKAFLKGMPEAEAKTLLKVLSAFPVDEPPKAIVISFSGDGLTNEPNKAVLDVLAATRSLEALQLKYQKGKLLDAASPDGVPLLQATNNIVAINREKYIDSKISASKGELPQYILEQLQNNDDNGR